MRSASEGGAYVVRHRVVKRLVTVSGQKPLIQSQRNDELSRRWTTVKEGKKSSLNICFVIIESLGKKSGHEIHLKLCKELWSNELKAFFCSPIDAFVRHVELNETIFFANLHSFRQIRRPILPP